MAKNFFHRNLAEYLKHLEGVDKEIKLCEKLAELHKKKMSIVHDLLKKHSSELNEFTTISNKIKGNIWFNVKDHKVLKQNLKETNEFTPKEKELILNLNTAKKEIEEINQVSLSMQKILSELTQSIVFKASTEFMEGRARDKYPEFYEKNIARIMQEYSLTYEAFKEAPEEYLAVLNNLIKLNSEKTNLFNLKEHLNSEEKLIKRIDFLGSSEEIFTKNDFLGMVNKDDVLAYINEFVPLDDGYTIGSEYLGAIHSPRWYDCAAKSMFYAFASKKQLFICQQLLEKQAHKEIASLKLVKNAKILEIGGGSGFFNNFFLSQGAKTFMEIDPLSHTDLLYKEPGKKIINEQNNFYKGNLYPLYNPSPENKKNIYFYPVPIYLIKNTYNTIMNETPEDIFDSPFIPKNDMKYKKIIKKIFTEKFDFIFSINTLDSGSGVGSDQNVEEIITICSQITKKGCYNYHEGNIAANLSKEFYKANGFEIIAEMKSHSRGVLLQKIN
ncbi:MAG: hypothetical protein KKF46_00740 [Nanoarchaeota archaeon]|nr:hypothetical protein [Nanoarchaeota archaeon]MBU1320860.1 hypothetical protein [Nanoarchaeota archaeon]MBU1597926.1 hypothetical protein [Nanoarchaeota archaeon]MBU2441338.1 hypothetical protein [Nanoarchaeota archaeon]